MNTVTRVVVAAEWQVSMIAEIWEGQHVAVDISSRTNDSSLCAIRALLACDTKRDIFEGINDDMFAFELMCLNTKNILRKSSRHTNHRLVASTRMWSSRVSAPKRQLFICKLLSSICLFLALTAVNCWRFQCLF